MGQASSCKRVPRGQATKVIYQAGRVCCAAVLQGVLGQWQGAILPISYGR